MVFEDRHRHEISGAAIIGGGAVLLAAPGLFAALLAGAIAFGFPANGVFGPQGIVAAGLLLGTITLSVASFAVRFGFKTIANRWREGAENARQVRDWLKSKHFTPLDESSSKAG